MQATSVLEPLQIKPIIYKCQSAPHPPVILILAHFIQPFDLRLSRSFPNLR
jgi:hypothetical protein